MVLKLQVFHQNVAGVSLLLGIPCIVLNMRSLEMGIIRATALSAFFISASCMVIDREISSLEARAGWTFLGCYIDNVSGRALPNGVQVAGGSSAMTNELCESTCLSAGYLIAGTEYAGECWCGNAVVNGGGPAPDGNVGCSMACKGNSAEKCGGSNRLDVYSYGSGGTPTSTTKASTTTTSAPTITSVSGGNPLPGWNFLGCYADNVSGRALPVSVSVSGGNTNEGCQSACLSAGYVIAGTEYAGECWCGNAVGGGGGPAPDGSAQCNMKCSGNSAEICGGPNRLDVYQHPPIPPSPTTAYPITSATPESTTWKNLGCYIDNVNGRALPNQVTPSGSFTIESCQKACLIAGYVLAGVESGSQCFCNMKVVNGGGPAPDGSTGCNVKCSGNSAETCGGNNRLNVYQWLGTGVAKRGINYTPSNNYNDATLANLLANYPTISWAYDYGDTGAYNLASNIEFIPMLFTAGEDYNTWAAAMANPNPLWNGTKNAFSFNEPDLTYSQSANLHPDVAAQNYIKYMQPFAGKVRLGMPCVLWNNQYSYSSGGPYNSPKWLEYFVGNCTNCHFDFMCIHYYQDCTYPNSLNYFFQNVTQAYDSYKLPVVINEFECTIPNVVSGNNPTQISWMQAVLPWLDEQSFVERYSWFGDYPDYLVTHDQTMLSPLGITYATWTG